MPTRREFIRKTGVIAGAATLWPLRVWGEEDVWPFAPYRTATVVECSGKDYKRLLAAALGKLGGLNNFVRPGASVLIKPNMAWDRQPEFAANTNPLVVAALVELTLAAGARKVKVYDNTCDDRRRCYDQSGIADAARDAGAEVIYVDEGLAKKIPIPAGMAVREAAVFADVISNDVILNVPVAKHHSLAGLTLGMKNLMGLLVENRGRWHQRLNAKLVDLASALKPALTVVDATRILTANGPSGGDLTYVKRLDKLIVTPDVAAADAYAATLFGLAPEDIGVVKEARRRNFGTTELAHMDVIKVAA